MDKREFMQLLSEQLSRLTRFERYDVCNEFSGHIDERAEALSAHDYSNEQAEQRAVLMMGDPVEIGQAINRQYSTFWLVMIVVSALLVLYLGLLLWGSVRSGNSVFNAAYAASATYDFVSFFDEPEAAADTDYQMEVGDYILRVYYVQVGHDVGGPYDTLRPDSDFARQVYLHVYAYHKNPFKPVAQNLFSNGHTVLQNEAGEEDSLHARALASVIYHDYASLHVPLGDDDTYVTLRCDFLGEHAALTIPLPRAEGANETEGAA